MPFSFFLFYFSFVLCDTIITYAWICYQHYTIILWYVVFFGYTLLFAVPKCHFWHFSTSHVIIKCVVLRHSSLWWHSAEVSLYQRFFTFSCKNLKYENVKSNLPNLSIKHIFRCNNYVFWQLNIPTWFYSYIMNKIAEY